jgi:putative Ca2+/H+ antiporter (TMEM165/GDT1 family)
VVGLAEVGDKTQILTMIPAARFRQPTPIMFRILFATIANHAAGGLAGTLFGDLLSGSLMRWILGLSFLSVIVWALFTDKYEGRSRRLAAGVPSFRR